LVKLSNSIDNFHSTSKEVILRLPLVLDFLWGVHRRKEPARAIVIPTTLLIIRWTPLQLPIEERRNNLLKGAERRDLG
jgi:hypothetical protein